MYRVEPRLFTVVFVVMFSTAMAESLNLFALAAFLGAGSSGASPSRAMATLEAWMGAVGNPLLLIAAFFFVTFLLKSALQNFLNVLIVDFRTGIADTHRLRLFDRMLHARWSKVGGVSPQRLRTALTLETSRLADGASSLLRVASLALLAASQYAIALAMFPLLTLAATAILLPGYFFVRLEYGRSRRLGRSISDGLTNMMTVVGQTLDSLKMVKVFQREEAQTDRFSATLRRLRNARLDFTRNNASRKFLLDAYVATAVCALVLLTTGNAAALSSDLLFLVVVGLKLRSSASTLHVQLEDISQVLSAFGAVGRLTDDLAAAAERPRNPAAGRISLASEITFDNVSYSYEGSGDRMALANASFSIPAFRVTVIAGPSGAGKSTTIALLLGLLSPRGGEIRVDGAALRGDTLDAWRNSVACVPQDINLFDETLESNLRWVDANASDAEIRRALKRAAALDFASRLPDGVGSRLGDRGAFISAGERQRIALAQAFLLLPSVLLLDEPTSSLDPDNAEMIFSALKRFSRENGTVVIVSHSENSLRFADDIIFLQEGRVRLQTASKGLVNANEDERRARIL